MPGWFCKNSSTGQLDPFADQATVHQRKQRVFFFFHFTTNTTNCSSDLISTYSTSPLFPIALIIQLLGRFHAAVTASVGNCWYYLALKIRNKGNKTLKVLFTQMAGGCLFALVRSFMRNQRPVAKVESCWPLQLVFWFCYPEKHTPLSRLLLIRVCFSVKHCGKGIICLAT